jgi:methionyl-tRNA formyltransferase
MPIQPEDTAGSLSERLAEAGADLLIRTLPAYLAGTLQPQSQDDSQATYAGMISKEEGRLDFNQPADALERRVRAFQPWPSAFMDFQGQPLKILKARVSAGELAHPGTRSIIDELPATCTPMGWLLFEEVQPAGKRPMTGRDFLRGARQWSA